MHHRARAVERRAPRLDPFVDPADESFGEKVAACLVLAGLLFVVVFA